MCVFATERERNRKIRNMGGREGQSEEVERIEGKKRNGGGDSE